MRRLRGLRLIVTLRHDKPSLIAKTVQNRIIKIGNRFTCKFYLSNLPAEPAKSGNLTATKSSIAAQQFRP
jgi:hypothetical protein